MNDFVTRPVNCYNPLRLPRRRQLVYDASFGNIAVLLRASRMTVTSRGLYAYLTMLTGNRAGTNFPLDARRKTLIGRGTDCHISLPDPLCSRVHATLTFTPDGWVIRDAESRNGTLVNGQKIDEATVVDGNTIRVGSAEFEFHESEEPPTAKGDDPQLMQTIVQDMPIAVQESHEEALAGLPSTEQVKELMLLYQLCIKLLGCGDPNRVVEIALDLLRKRTERVGRRLSFGQRRRRPAAQARHSPRCGRSRDAESIAHRARFAARPRRVGRQSVVEDAMGARDLGHFADAVCAPLVRRNVDGERTTLGAIHVYLEDGRFRQSDFDFIISVANIVAIALVRARALTTLQSDYQRLVEKSPGHDELIGNCPADARPEIENQPRGAVRPAACWCAAKAVRARSSWRGRFIAPARGPIGRWSSVNCAAIPADLMESQLFGHKAGSFTGADRDHIGFFQQADLGTLFLDEVGELTLEGQAKLLRILEGHPFLPVGATEEVSVDVRVIAATNQNLQKYVREKRFREDLYYRLSVFELHLPPLRDRGDDIGLLVDFFLDHFRRLHGRPNLGLTDVGPRQAARLPLARQRAAASQRARQRGRAGRGGCDPAARPGPARLGQQRAGNAPHRRMGEAADHRSPQPHRRQRARSGQAARHRPGHAVSQDRAIPH